jgi:starch phosphorylase
MDVMLLAGICAKMRVFVTGWRRSYEYGIFKQEIVERCQVEVPDTWLQNGNPWEIMRPEYAVPVKMYGKVWFPLLLFRESIISVRLPLGIRTVLAHHCCVWQTRLVNGGWEWYDTATVIAMPYDTPIPGYLPCTRRLAQGSSQTGASATCNASWAG